MILGVKATRNMPKLNDFAPLPSTNLGDQERSFTSATHPQATPGFQVQSRSHWSSIP